MRIQILGCFVLTFITCLCFSNHSSAYDWPQFRGPNGNGVLEKIEHPQEWGDGKNVAWSVEIPGGGLSSPVILGERVFLTTAVGFDRPVSFMEGVRDMRPKKPAKALQFQVICLNLKDGKKIWDQTIAEQAPNYPIHGSNSFATESPATDGKHLYVYFAAIGTVAALDLDGKEVWRADVGAYPTGNGFGTGSSLSVGGGKVFVQCDNDQSSFVVAFDGATGKEAWKKPREGRTSWSTPLFWKNDKRSELIACGSGFVTSYDPQSGAELWTMSGVGMSFSSSPAIDKNQIYFGNSGPRSSGPLVAVSNTISGKQSFSENAVAAGHEWSVMQAGPGMSSPVSVNGKVFVPGRGTLSCYSADDGELVYKQRLPVGSMAASLWASAERLFIMDESGKTLVLETGDKPNIVATNQIGDDLFWSTPAISGKSLLLRGAKKIYCIRE